jgi:hypothetical protein
MVKTPTRGHNPFLTGTPSVYKLGSHKPVSGTGSYLVGKITDRGAFFSLISVSCIFPY